MNLHSVALQLAATEDLALTIEIGPDELTLKRRAELFWSRSLC
jgi:hypothetical protein